jgi:hypothetical protein
MTSFLKIFAAGRSVLTAITQVELLGQPVTFRIGSETFTLTKNS